MTKSLIESRYYSKYTIKIQTQILKNKTSDLPSNLQSFKQKLVCGNGFVVYK